MDSVDLLVTSDPVNATTRLGLRSEQAMEAGSLHIPSNRALVFKRVPQGLPREGVHLAVEARDRELRCPDGGIVVKAQFTSIDPYQRGRMRSADVKYYSPAMKIGDTFVARSIATVVTSRNPAFKGGDVVIGMLPIQEYIALGAERLPSVKLLENTLDIQDTRVFLGALGVPGLTAYIGLYDIGKPKAGQTILVSAASGAVGQIVGQLAKKEGLRTIGSVGSDEKARYIIEQLGFDGAFNYKTEKPSDAVGRLAPEGLDIYYDNVGGEHLDAALRNMKDFGRVVMCGTIADYNSGEPLGESQAIRSSGYIFSRRLTVKGFIVSDSECANRYALEHVEQMSPLIKDGRIKTKMWEVEGIQNAPQAFLSLFSGGNFGKTILKY